MIKAELYKLRTHRTPLATAATLLVGVLAPSVVMLWYTPTNTSAYADTWLAVYSILAILLAIVFGGWALGTEYRQDTVKRMLASEPRRGRALATKASAAAASMTAVLAAVAGLGWLAARVVGDMNDVMVAWEGRQVLATVFTALLAGAMTFGLSAITRSDSFAMIGMVGLLLVLDPLLGLIPKIGDYTLGSSLSVVSDKIAGTASGFGEVASLSTSSATLTLVAWLVAFVGGGTVLFASRDI